jgi:hypothetical protein
VDRKGRHGAGPHLTICPAKPAPSQAGIQMTKAIIDIAMSLGIAVPDHVVARTGMRV